MLLRTPDCTGSVGLTVAPAAEYRLNSCAALHPAVAVLISLKLATTAEAVFDTAC